MIRSNAALLRHAREFFLSQLLGLYSWDKDVRLSEPELRPAIAPNLPVRERRQELEARQGLGKYFEQERVRFGPWEILLYSSAERPPVGEVLLRDDAGAQVVAGPLDPATWDKIGEHIRSMHQRKAS